MKEHNFNMANLCNEEMIELFNSMIDIVAHMQINHDGEQEIGLKNSTEKLIDSRDWFQYYIDIKNEEELKIQ